MKKAVLLLITCMVCFSLTACGKVKMENSASFYFGSKLEDVVSEFEDLGFTDITTENIEDLTSNSALRDGEVGNISIDGDTDFEEGAKYKKDVPVIITYHTIKKLEIPISVEEIQELDYLEIETEFKNAGFEQVDAIEVFDLDPDTIEVEYENEVTVEGRPNFEKKELVPFDAPIHITCHRPYAKYDVKVIVDFVGNWFFNTYDVKVSLGTESFTLEHGKDTYYEFRLKEGTYTLKFENIEDSSVKGETKLEVTSNLEAKYQIGCLASEVVIETLYVDRDIELTDEQAKVKNGYKDYVGKPYKDVVQEFFGYGFKSIKSQAVRDLKYIGDADEGKVKEIFIDGNSDFTRGEIYDNSVEVLIKYHMPKEDAIDITKEQDTENNKDTVSDTTENSDNSKLTIENNADFAAIMKVNATDYSAIKNFVNSYKGRIIEFDGCIALMMNHGNFNTRFDVCIAGGDYTSNSTTGPLFAYENVNYNEMKVKDSDIVAEGMDFRITAKIEGWNEDGGYIILKPISMKLR